MDENLLKERYKKFSKDELKSFALEEFNNLTPEAQAILNNELKKHHIFQTVHDELDKNKQDIIAYNFDSELAFYQTKRREVLLKVLTGICMGLLVAVLLRLIKFRVSPLTFSFIGIIASFVITNRVGKPKLFIFKPNSILIARGRFGYFDKYQSSFLLLFNKLDYDEFEYDDIIKMESKKGASEYFLTTKYGHQTLTTYLFHLDKEDLNRIKLILEQKGIDVSNF